MKAGTNWIFLRLAVIAVNIVGFLSIPIAQSNLGWDAALVSSIVISVGVYLWLMAVRYRPQIDWSLPYSFNQPFWPMMKYPLRFWFLASCALLIGGGTTMLRDVIEHNGHEAIGGTFFVTGLSLAAALKLWIWRFARTGT